MTTTIPTCKTGAWFMMMARPLIIVIPMMATTMLDGFIVKALLAGVGFAAIAGPLGCFVIWRRMSYFGDTLAHAALLGVALSFVLELHVMPVVFAVSLLLAAFLLVLQSRTSLPSDALLGLLSHASLAAGLIALSLMTWLRIDVMGLLFGDLLTVNAGDLLVLYGGGTAVLVALAVYWKPLFATTVSREIAAAEGINVSAMDLLFVGLLAATVAVAIKIVGVLLVTAMLIIPAATARRLASGPLAMVFLAMAGGMMAVALGLGASLKWDTPVGPSVVAASSVLFLLTMVLPLRLWHQEKN